MEMHVPPRFEPRTCRTLIVAMVYAVPVQLLLVRSVGTENARHFPMTAK